MHNLNTYQFIEIIKASVLQRANDLNPIKLDLIRTVQKITHKIFIIKIKFKTKTKTISINVMVSNETLVVIIVLVQKK